MVVYEAVTNLQNMLSIAQDNTLSNFAVDQFIPVLLDILRRYPESDISNEINSKHPKLDLSSARDDIIDKPDGHLPEYMQCHRAARRSQVLHPRS